MKQNLLEKQPKYSPFWRLTYWLFRPSNRLSQRVIHAGFWAFVLQFMARVFGLARTTVLARVLSPKDFGLFGIASIGISVLNTFLQTGVQAALVQKKEDIKPYLDTAWTVQVIRGFVFAGILFGIAPYVASFFGEPIAVLLLRVLGLSAVFEGFTNIGVVYFQKELDFHKRFIFMFSGIIADFGIAISAALILRNVWALVFGILAGNFVRMVISYVIHPYRPSIKFQTWKFKELYRFGIWLWGVSLISFFALHADKAIVGKLLGTVALGFYVLSARLANIIAVELGRVVSSVTFPAYSKIQKNVPQLRKGILKTLEITTFISFPVAAIMILLAPEIVCIFFGEKWKPMTETLQILALAGLIRNLTALSAGFFRGIGKPYIEFWLTLVRSGVMLSLAIFLGRLWGITGIATASLIGVGITLPIWWSLIGKETGIKVITFIEKLLPSFLGVAVMGLILKFTQTAINGITVFTIVMLGGIIAYLLPLLILWRYFKKGPINTIINIMSGRGQ